MIRRNSLRGQGKRNDIPDKRDYDYISPRGICEHWWVHEAGRDEQKTVSQRGSKVPGPKRPTLLY